MTTTPIAPPRQAPAGAPPHSSHRRGVWAVAFVVLLVILGGELGARALAPRLPRPLAWNQREAALIVEQMKRVRHADTAFLGSSVANFGFEPDAFEPGSSYNASLPGSSLVSIERWAEEMVVPLLSPKRVVLGITSRDVNDNGAPQRDNLRQYLTSPERKHMLGIESTFERVERFASEHSALIRLRAYLRRPASVAKQLRGEPALERTIAFGPLGQPRFPEANYEFGESPARRAWELDALRGFGFTRNMQALARLAGWLRTRGIDLVVVDMPVVDSVYVPYHPKGRADFAAYRSALRVQAAAADIRLLSFAGDWDARTWFVDSIHLNRRGAAKLTETVARELSL